MITANATVNVEFCFYTNRIIQKFNKLEPTFKNDNNHTHCQCEKKYYQKPKIKIRVKLFFHLSKTKNILTRKRFVRHKIRGDGWLCLGFEEPTIVRNQAKKSFLVSRPFSNQRSPDRERAMHNVGGAQHLASGIIGQMCYISKGQILQLPGEALSNDLIGEVLSTYEACSKSFRALQRTTCSDLPWTSTIP